MPRPCLICVPFFILLFAGCGGGMAEEVEILSGQRAATAEPPQFDDIETGAPDEPSPPPDAGDPALPSAEPSADGKPRNSAPAPSETVNVEAGAIEREALVQMLDQGIPRFLQQVQAKPLLSGGRFVGWKLTSFFAGDQRLADTWIKPGDTVVRVNERSIERPESFKTVWDSLYTARELNVTLLREGRVYRLHYLIEQQPPAAAEAKCVCKNKRCKCSEATAPSP